MRLIVLMCTLGLASAQAADYSSTPPDELERVVATGDRAAQCELGNRSLRGRNAASNTERGKQLVVQAAEGGFADCQYSLGMMYKDGRWQPQDAKKAEVWLSKAAQQGHAFAQVELALMYEKGLGDVGKDPARALGLYRAAAKLWHPVGMFHYGRLLQKNPDTTAEGRAWLQLASEKGDFDAQTLLGSLPALQGSDILLYERTLMSLRATMPRTTTP